MSEYRKPRMWKMPARKAFAPEGVALGATVTGIMYAASWAASHLVRWFA